MHTAEMDKVGELQAKLDALRAHRVTLEKQKAQLNDTLEAVASRRAPLVKLHAKGDATAAKRLDDLDTEERSIRRSLEGIDGHLASNLAETSPVETEFAKESAIVAARKQQELYEARLERTRAQFQKEKALESELTDVHTTLHEYLNDLTTNFQQFGGSNVASQIYDEMAFHLARVNAGWYPSPKTFGNNSALTIRPMLPPKR
jgi:chromosome segregation ATPase